MSVVADPDEALIEAIAEAMWLDDLAFDGLTTEEASAEFPWPPEEDLADAYRHSARAALAAMVEHLGLVEEWGVRFERQADPRMGNPSGVVTVEQKVANEVTAHAAVKNGAPIGAKNRRVVRRLVSRWTEVEP